MPTSDDDEIRPHNAYRDDKVYVCAEMCSTCVFRPGNMMRLERGRVKGMVDAANADDSSIICHKTLYTEPQGNAVCRGFFDNHKTTPLQIAERMGIIEEVNPDE